VLECLPTRCEALSSNPTANNKKKKCTQYKTSEMACTPQDGSGLLDQFGPFAG
jgi:hypothetical protein